MLPLKLGELLKSKGFLTDSQIKVALAEQTITEDRIGKVFVKLAFVSSMDMSMSLAEQAGLPFLDISGYNISEDVLRLVPRETAERMGFLPLNLEDGVITIGITNAENILAIDAAARIAGKPPKVYMMDSGISQEMLEKAYFFLENPILAGIENVINTVKTGGTPTGAMITSITDSLIRDGIRRNATDVHITPTLETVHVFYRVDGVLQQGHCLPMSVLKGIVSRIKILSELDIAEQRLPQDGSFTFTFLNKTYDMRVSSLPTIYGENVVIRILSSGGGPLLRIASLGFDEEDSRQLRHIFLKPFGMIIIAGPSGSGKTTTLYAALKEINLIEKNVLTVEDPVEYRLSMVKQTSLSEKAGYNFDVAVRSFMRQDPDVILLGEIRDEESANIAVRASITGHLLLSTIHTNDAVSSIPRLVNFNIDRFLLSSSLLAVVGQRLIRKICEHCKTDYTFKEGELKGMGFPDVEGKVKTGYRGKGCSVCSHTGYLGRTIIGEILIVDDDIKEQIYTGASASAIGETAVRKGMKTIRDNGVKKAVDGITTFEEIQRVVG